MLLIYSCAGYAFASMIAVDIPRWTAPPCRPAVLVLSIVIAVDTRLSPIFFRFADRDRYTALVIYSCDRYAFYALLNAVDIPHW